MPSCSSCGAHWLAGALPGAQVVACAHCGAPAVPDLELEPAKGPVPRSARRSEKEAELTIELAADPRSTRGPAEVGASPAGGHGAHATALVHEGPRGGGSLLPRDDRGETFGDVAFDARLLADYGTPPRHWVLSPVYAWRVLTRRRDLKRGLVGRREEASRAAHDLDDARVAFAERSRAVAEKHPSFARWFEQLRGAEEVLRSRDLVLASEQDAQTARLASVDARLRKLEAELAHAQAEERAIAGEVASSQAALARGEAKLKRAESELRSAHQREGTASE